MTDETLVQITAPHFCAGAVLIDDQVARTADILRYMRRWPLDRVRSYCQRKYWLLTILHADGTWEFSP